MTQLRNYTSGNVNNLVRHVDFYDPIYNNISNPLRDSILNAIHDGLENYQIHYVYDKDFYVLSATHNIGTANRRLIGINVYHRTNKDISLECAARILGFLDDEMKSDSAVVFGSFCNNLSVSNNILAFLVSYMVITKDDPIITTKYSGLELNEHGRS
jgi:hypothetical protein